MDGKKNKTDFLQSAQWRKFQESVGRKAFHLESDDFSASIISHKLPLVGDYFYCPRWPKKELSSCTQELSSFLARLFELAKKNNAGWIRIEPENQEVLDLIKENIIEKIVKAPHDMQPREVFVLDISKNEEDLLSEMKSKTRYNINLAKKKGVSVKIADANLRMNSNLRIADNEYVEAFLRLTKEMALRNGITAHPENYYRKMIESLPEDMLSIYIAEYENEIIAANLVLFYGDTATYLHGASGNTHRNVMAPFLLQWQAILDAKQRGCKFYDFGGVKIGIRNQELGIRSNDLAGITNFKLGFSPSTKPLEFPGSYDIIVNPRAYALYRGLQRAKAFAYRFRK